MDASQVAQRRICVDASLLSLRLVVNECLLRLSRNQLLADGHPELRCELPCFGRLEPEAQHANNSEVLAKPYVVRVAYRGSRFDANR